LSLAMVVATAIHGLLIANVSVSKQEPYRTTQPINLSLLVPEVVVAEPAGKTEASRPIASATEADTALDDPVPPTPRKRESVLAPGSQPIRPSQEVAAEEHAPKTAPRASERFQEKPGFEMPFSELIGEIANFEDLASADPASFQGRPRIRRIDSTSARRTADTYYLESWRRRIESIGKLNYPDEARARNIRGDLSVLVTIRPDGSLKQAKILRSSGHQILDDAALRILRLAAPYPPFPQEMRRSTDLLEIVRSWQFQRSS